VGEVGTLREEEDLVGSGFADGATAWVRVSMGHCGKVRNVLAGPERAENAEEGGFAASVGTNCVMKVRERVDLDV